MKKIKQFMGDFKDWKLTRVPIKGKDFYIIEGTFDGHPVFHGLKGHSSSIVNLSFEKDKIVAETRNSIYHLDVNSGSLA